MSKYSWVAKPVKNEMTELELRGSKMPSINRIYFAGVLYALSMCDIDNTDEYSRLKRYLYTTLFYYYKHDFKKEDCLKLASFILNDKFSDEIEALIESFSW